MSGVGLVAGVAAHNVDTSTIRLSTNLCNGFRFPSRHAQARTILLIDWPVYYIGRFYRGSMHGQQHVQREQQRSPVLDTHPHLYSTSSCVSALSTTGPCMGSSMHTGRGPLGPPASATTPGAASCAAERFSRPSRPRKKLREGAEDAGRRGGTSREGGGSS